LRPGRCPEPGSGPSGNLDRDYGGTAATRAFWERPGFTQVDTIDPLPVAATQPSGQLCCGAPAHPVTRPIDQFGAVTHREHHHATREQIGGCARLTRDRADHAA
jgi:hypothetical protein